MQSKSAPKF